MRSTFFIILFVILQLNAHSQTFDPAINTLISSVNIDTLTKYVNDLSGENTVVINNQTTTITHRIDLNGNDLATDYIIETLQKTGLTVLDDNYNAFGRNVIATQLGTDHPEIFYMICAHYDAIPNHGADDNASGVAAVLEAARILSKSSFSHSIIYALWDQEEIGLIGSRDWANDARDENVIISAIINLDMIAYNTTADHRFDIFSSTVANSIHLGNYVSGFCNTYNLDLTPRIHIVSAGRSDQDAFWEKNYSALLLIEPTELNLFNPHYHTDLDRINLFNMPFFHEMSKLGIGSLASLSSGEQFTAIDDIEKQDLIDFHVYPNPVKENGYVKISLLEPSQVKIDILSITGITLKTISNDFLSNGEHLFNIPNNLPSGAYLVRLQTDYGSQYKKLIVVK